MASINGISIKNEVTWLGREGYATQGDLYLDGEKIGFWSQDGNGGEDRYDFEEKYSEDKFIKVVNELNKDNDYVYESNGVRYVLKFNIDHLMNDLLELQELEKEYNRIYYSNNRTMAVILNHQIRKILQLPTYAPDIDNELIKLSIKKQTNEFREKYGSDNIQIKIFRSFKDFDIGVPIRKDEIYNFKKLKDTFRWEMIILKDKTLSKDDFNKLDKIKQDEILNMEVISSTKSHCYYEKEYFLSFFKEDKSKDEIELEER